MTSEKLYLAIGDIDGEHIRQAKKTVTKSGYKVRGVMAACLCVIVCGGILLHNVSSGRPDPEYLQIANPLLEVASEEEMEKYLDFDVPVLEKEVDAYIVIVLDDYPEIGRIIYKDGGIFDMKYGTGDISGIYGGVFIKEEMINHVKISFYQYEDIRYALWETGGFTYCLSGGDDLEKEINVLTK